MSSTSASIPYLGSKISLISKAKIRYEGILYTIDPQESTVALAKVRSYGTENRPVDNPLPPKDEVYEYIIFRAADIDDLQVSEPPRPTPLHETIPHMDPAIVQHAPATYGNQPQSMIGPVAHSRQVTYRNSQEMPIQPTGAGSGRSYDGGRRRIRTVAPPNIFRQNTFQPNNRGMYRRSRDRNVSFGVPNPSRSPRIRNRSVGGGSLKFDGDFDFEKANEEFSKLAKKITRIDLNNDNVSEVALEQTQQITEIPNESGKDVGDTESYKENEDVNDKQQADLPYHDIHYDKNKSFFDKISCEALEREKGEESRIRKSWQEERHQNAETFGFSVNWTRFNPRYGGGNRQYMMRRGSAPSGNRQMYANYRRTPFYNYQIPHQQHNGEYQESNSRMMDPLPSWYNDYTTPSIPVPYQQRFNGSSYGRRGGNFNRNTSYNDQRRYPVYG